MTRIMRRMALVAVLAGAGMARAEMSYIVEVTDLQKTVTRQVVTSAELKDLKKAIEAESRVFAKAVELAKKEWDAAEKANKPGPGEKAVPSTPFPNGALSPRRCQEKGSFTKAEEAQKRVEQMDMAEADAAARKAKRAAGTANAKNTKNQERDAAVSRAAFAVQDKIDELIKNPAGAAAKPAEAAGAEGAAAADKPAAGAKPAAAKPAAGGF